MNFKYDLLCKYLLQSFSIHFSTKRGTVVADGALAKQHIVPESFITERADVCPSFQSSVSVKNLHVSHQIPISLASEVEAVWKGHESTFSNTSPILRVLCSSQHWPTAECLSPRPFSFRMDLLFLHRMLWTRIRTLRMILRKSQVDYGVLNG